MLSVVDRADQLMACTENSEDKDEFVAIGEAVTQFVTTVFRTALRVLMDNQI